LKTSDGEIILDSGELRFIEGHGRLLVKVSGKKIVAEFQNLEGPRFLTKYLAGKPAEMAPMVASRICGLCYTAHSINSAEAVEKALGINVSKEVTDLRNVLYLANNLRSHMMHLLYLSIPPIEGLISVLRLRNKDVYRSAAKVLAKSTDLIEIWGGRSVHVPNVVVGGFGAPMKGKELLNGVRELEALKKDAMDFVRYALDLELPEIERYRLLAGLKKPQAYPVHSEGARMALTDGSSLSNQEYFEGLREVQKEYSTSKHVYFKESEISVGALSRIILNKSFLSPAARELAEEVEWSMNPFLMIKAQAIEIVHYIEELVRLGQELSDVMMDAHNPGVCSVMDPHGEVACAYSGTHGKGAFIAEAPRGTLCHYCEVEDGLIKDYRVYTPTAVNSRSIEGDAADLVKRFRPLGMEKLKFVLEDLVRSYDPCLSCAVSLDAFD
jgi:coenzyme F420-reducing hydrogenase alpha subunit